MLSEGVGSPCATDGANHHVSIWVLGLNPGPVGRAASCPIPFEPSLQFEYIQLLSHTKAPESLFWRHQTGIRHHRLSQASKFVRQTFYLNCLLRPQMDLTNLPSYLLHVLPSSKDTVLLSARENASTVWKFFCFLKTSLAGTFFWNQLHVAAPSWYDCFPPLALRWWLLDLLVHQAGFPDPTHSLQSCRTLLIHGVTQWLLNWQFIAFPALCHHKHCCHEYAVPMLSR